MQSTRYLIRACSVALFLLLAADSLARPFSQQQKREKLGRRDVNQFPDGVPTSPSATDENRLQPCTEHVTETFANGTYKRVVTACCEGYTGDNCDEKVPPENEPASGDGDKTLDPMDPCKNLQCLGVDGAHCLTVSKCGERWPVFLLGDGTLAPCTNGQPVNVTRLTCTERCSTDPCAGQTCSEFPDAFCVHTACDCNEPMWLLDTGVQVDCDSGEHLSPEEARERRRRRKRQAENTVPSPTPSCT